MITVETLERRPADVDVPVTAVVRTYVGTASYMDLERSTD